MGGPGGIWPCVCLLPALAAFMVLEIVPALGTSIFSFTDYTGLPHAAVNWVGLQNYHDLLTGGQTFLIRALQVTVIFSLLVTVIQNGVAVLIAWLLNSRLRGQISFRSLVFLPVGLGATVKGQTLYLLVNALSGAVTPVLPVLR